MFGGRMRQVPREGNQRWHRVLTVVLICVATLLPAGPAGAADKATGLRLATVSDAAWPRVTILAVAPTVLSGLTLPKAAFTVTAGGARIPAEVTPLPRDRWDIALVLAGAPQGDDKAVRGAALELLRALDPGSRVAVQVGSRRIDGLTPDRFRTGRAIARASFRSGDDRLTAATLQTIEVALRRSPRQRAVVVLGSVRGVSGWPTIIPAWHGAQVFAVTSLAAGFPRSLVSAARNTGGNAVSVPVARLISAVDDVAAELSGEYHLRFSLPKGSPAAPVTVQVKAYGTTKQATVFLGPTRVEPPEFPGAKASSDSGGISPGTVLAVVAALVLLGLGRSLVRSRHGRSDSRRRARHRA